MTDLDYANLCARIYQVDASTDKFWAHYWEIDDVVCGHTIVEKLDVIVFRGSVTLEDWLRDVAAIPMWHSKLGFVHSGFYKGLDTLYPLIQAVVVGKQIAITGHSLGAARACDMAGLFVYDTGVGACPVTELVTFGQPKPAWANLGRIITKSGMRHISYRNRNDPVSLVPPPPFENTELWVSLNAEPSPTDLEPLRDHHIQLYIKGLTQVLSTL